MSEIASAFVTVAPDASGFGRKLDSSIGGDMKSSGSKAGKVFGTAMKVGAAAIVGGALVAGKFLADSIGEAREAQKVTALTNSTIKATGSAAGVTAKHVADLAGALSLKTGIDDETIQSGQNMLLTFKNIRNEAGKGNDIFDQTSKTLVDLSAAMGSEPKQAAIQLGKALNDPVKGISALSRVGVTFTEGQKKVIGSLVEGGKTAEAQKIILKELNSEFGGAAAAQATAGEKAKVAFGNLQEAVGTALLPTLDKVLNSLTDFLILITTRGGPALLKLKGFFADLGGSGGAGGLLTALSGIVASVRTNFLPVMQAAANTFQTSILPAVTRLATYLRATLFPIFAQVAGIIRGQVVPIVASLARFFYGSLYPAIVQIVTAIATKLKPVFDQLASTYRSQILPAVSQLLAKFHQYQPTIQRIILVVVKVIGAVLTFAAAILGKVLPPVIKFAGFLQGNVYKTIGIVIGILVKVIAAIIDFGASLIEAGKKAGQFASAVGDKIAAALNFVREIPSKVRSAIGDLGSLLYNAGQELIQGLIDGISSKIAAVADKMSEVANKVKGFLPGSPVKEGPLTSWNNGGAGKRLVGLLADGLGDTRPVTAAMDRLSAGVAVRGPGVMAHAVAGAGSGRGPAVVNIFDVDGVLIGTMDGRIQDHEDLRGQRARAM